MIDIWVLAGVTLHCQPDDTIAPEIMLEHYAIDIFSTYSISQIVYLKPSLPSRTFFPQKYPAKFLYTRIQRV